MNKKKYPKEQQQQDRYKYIKKAKITQMFQMREADQNIKTTTARQSQHQYRTPEQDIGETKKKNTMQNNVEVMLAHSDKYIADCMNCTVCKREGDEKIKH